MNLDSVDGTPSQNDLRGALFDHIKARNGDALRRLQSNLVNCEPRILLAQYALYGLLNRNPNYNEYSQPDAILQADAELVQALILRHELADFPTVLHDPALFFEHVVSAARDAGSFMNATRLFTQPLPHPEDARNRQLLIERMRMNTQVVRNWGDMYQIVRIVSELFEPFDDDFDRLYGVRATSLITMCQEVVRTAEVRTREHLAATYLLLQSTSIEEAVTTFVSHFPDAGPESDLHAAISEMHSDVDGAVGGLLAYSDAFLPRVFTFGIEDFVRSYAAAVNRESLERVLSRWSLAFGECHDSEPSLLFLKNPVWDRPLIRLDSDSYYWPILGLFYSFVLGMLENLAADDQSLKARYERHRGAYLEAEVVRLFTSAFPGSLVFRGSQWQEPGSNDLFENDLLVTVGSVAFVVEAKAHRVTRSARRGGEDSLATKIKELVVKPAQQARGFASLLAWNRGLHTFVTKEGPVNEVDSSEIIRYVCLAVTLDDLAGLHSHTPSLQAAGLIPAGVSPVTTITLPDLEIIFRFLHEPWLRLHYLVRRPEYERAVTYVGDERDLLAVYMENGFRPSKRMNDGDVCYISGLSREIDIYNMFAPHGADMKKPHRRLTRWWRRTVRSIYDQGAPDWTETVCILLDMTFDEQQQFEKQIRHLQQRAKDRPGTEAFGEMVSHVMGLHSDQRAVIGVVYRAVSREMQPAFLRAAVERSREDGNISHAVVIGLDVRRRDYPFTNVTLMSFAVPATHPQMR